MEITTANIISALPQLIAVVMSIYSLYVSKGKRKADTASVLTGTALNLVTSLREKVNKMELSLNEKQTTITALEERVQSLEQLRDQLQEQLQNQIIENSEFESFSNSRIKALEDTLSRRRRELDSLRNYIQRIDELLLAKDLELEKAKIELDQARKQIEDLIKERDQLRLERENIQKAKDKCCK